MRCAHLSAGGGARPPLRGGGLVDLLIIPSTVDYMVDLGDPGPVVHLEPDVV